MNKFKLYMLGLGLASMGLASCTAGFLDVESKNRNQRQTISIVLRVMHGVP